MRPYEQYRRGWMLRFAGGRCLLYGLLLVFLVIEPPNPIAAPNTPFFFARNALISLVVICILASVLKRRGTRYVNEGLRQLRLLKWRICLECEHPLTGLSDEGHCPECGEYFHIDENRGGWKERLGGDPEEKPRAWKHWKQTSDTIAFFVLVGLRSLVR